jgi:hypothetical protein
MKDFSTGEIIELYGRKFRIVDPDITHAGIVYSEREVHATQGRCCDDNWITTTTGKVKEHKVLKKNNNNWYKRKAKRS